MRFRIVIYLIFFIGLIPFVDGMSRIIQARRLLPVSFSYIMSSPVGVQTLIGAGLMLAAVILWWRSRRK